MEENNNKENFQNETKETVNQVKNAFKGTNFKDEAMNTKNFFLKFIKAPISTVKEAACGEGNNIMIAIILLAILVIASVLSDVIFYSFSEYLDITVKTVVLDIISPVIFVAVFSMATYFMSGNSGKSLSTIVSALVIAITHIVIKNVIGVAYTLINEAISIGFIYSMLSNTLIFVAMVLLMKAIKGLITITGEEDTDFKKVVLIVFISYAVLSILSSLNIYSSF